MFPRKEHWSISSEPISRLSAPPASNIFRTPAVPLEMFPMKSFLIKLISIPPEEERAPPLFSALFDCQIQFSKLTAVVSFWLKLAAPKLALFPSKKQLLKLTSLVKPVMTAPPEVLAEFILKSQTSIIPTEFAP